MTDADVDTGRPLSEADLENAPTQIRHMAALGRCHDAITTRITAHPSRHHDPGRYEVVLIAESGDGQRKEIQFSLTRRKSKWTHDEPVFLEDGIEVDIAGGFAGMLRALSQCGDRVGSPTANTRHPGTNHALTQRAHTIIRN